ncbi:hypothetical protein KSO98_14100 [Nocardioides sp. R-N-C8]|nr:hypothetical protein [Nocardioides nematodiphilus]
MHGTSLTVKSSLPGSDGTTTDTTVTVDGSTTYTTTKSSDASALKVGQCVVATGQADDTGTVAASQLIVSAPVDGECSVGFGFGRSGTDNQGGAA